MKAKELLRSHRFWLAAFAALILLSSLSMLFMRRSAGGSVAVITQDGAEIQRIDLSEVKESYEIKVTNPSGGYNLVLVEPGAISVIEASCPDHVCIAQGKISDSLRPIVCLPNKLMITISGGETPDIDSVSG